MVFWPTTAANTPALLSRTSAFLLCFCFVRYAVLDPYAIPLFTSSQLLCKMEGSDTCPLCGERFEKVFDEDEGKMSTNLLSGSRRPRVIRQ